MSLFTILSYNVNPNMTAADLHRLPTPVYKELLEYLTSTSTPSSIEDHIKYLNKILFEYEHEHPNEPI